MNPTKFVPTVMPGGVAWVGRFWTMLARAACVGLAVLLVGACGAPSTISEPPVTAVEPTIEGSTTDLEELHALAKLYGYVRYFHPSDEAAAADWETIAVEGARRIVQGSTRAELLAALREIFQPLAPTLLVFPIEAPAEADPSGSTLAQLRRLTNATPPGSRWHLRACDTGVDEGGLEVVPAHPQTRAS